MRQHLFILDLLGKDVTPDDYEVWVRTVEYPMIEQRRDVESRGVTRIDSRVLNEADVPHDYIDVLQVANVEDFRERLEGDRTLDDVLTVRNELGRESIAVFGTVIE